MENTVRDRLMAYLDKKRISYSEFGRQLGVSSAYVHSIRQSIPPDKLKQIGELYPDLNIGWLIYGEGDMIVSADNGAAVNIGTDPAISKALDEIAEQRKLTAKSQEQIDRLIGVIETMQRGS